MSASRTVHRVDGPVRRTWASIGCVIAALAIVALLCIGQPVARAALGNSPGALNSWLARFLLASAGLGLVSGALALVAVVRDRGTPRVGAALILGCAAMQLGFAVWGTSSAVLEGKEVVLFNWVWALASLALIAVATVLVFIPPRPVTMRRD
ncbi:hypothetical protein SAMN05443377_12032 [Propionibacterium cyclohexanicum]|uniref:Uncharacterized protein n=1 Tax=Propionibacterium cyclohexanicum TaxID=64702 RepID=A0A1H9TAJ5_9ACTN|nr:hypothetical protein [Propionibacterium cyclohexanicum]SER94148.1 hypothetical protein SAMN05443377_12032 [Propionibacterium cyclohexanicum]